MWRFDMSARPFLRTVHIYDSYCGYEWEIEKASLPNPIELYFGSFAWNFTESDEMEEYFESFEWIFSEDEEIAFEKKPFKSYFENRVSYTYMRTAGSLVTNGDDMIEDD